MNWQGVSDADRAFLEALGDKEITGDRNHALHVISGGVSLRFTLFRGVWHAAAHWDEAEGLGPTAEAAYLALIHNAEGAAFRAQTRLGRLRGLCEKVVIARAMEKP